MKRRTLLGVCGSSVVAVAGCLNRNPKPVLNVQEFGAAGDGETDDTTAIQAVLDQATNGQTVYFPRGTYLVSARESSHDNEALVLDGDQHPDNLLIKGERSETTLLIDGDHSRNHIVFRVNINNGINGLQIRDLVIDGNRREQNVETAEEVGIGLLIRDALEEAEGNVNILVENVKAVGANVNGFTIKSGGVTLNYVSAVDNGQHGIVADSFSDAHLYDPPIKIRNAYATRNGVDNENGYGIDVSGGKVIIEDSIAENNYQGTKTTEEVVEATYRRVTLQNNEVHGLQRPSTVSTTQKWSSVTLDDIVSRMNGGFGFRFDQDTNYTIGTIISHSNGPGNILIKDDVRLRAEEIWSLDPQNGPNIFYGGGSDLDIAHLIYLTTDEQILGGDVNISTEPLPEWIGSTTSLQSPRDEFTTTTNTEINIESVGVDWDK